MGHWECQEVPCKEGFLKRLRRCCRHDCCEPCPTKVVPVWVPCPVWVETPVTHLVPTCEYVPTPVQVTVCKWVPRQETVRVCRYRCVAEPKVETYTALVPHCVPYEATRTVARCVPVEEKVTCCRLVPRVVEKQVPAEACCH
jgi:hypothetical protein